MLRSRQIASALLLIAGFALYIGLPSGQAKADIYDQPQNTSTNDCIAEYGTTDAVCGAGCSSNHSDFWDFYVDGGNDVPGSFEFKNEHSGLCLTVDGSNPGVYAAGCGDNHAQLWKDTTRQVYTVCQGFAGYLDEFAFTNVHTGEYLTEESGGSIDQTTSVTWWI